MAYILPEGSYRYYFIGLGSRHKEGLFGRNKTKDDKLFFFNLINLKCALGNSSYNGRLNYEFGTRVEIF